MKANRIAVTPGDGIGKEVMPEGLRMVGCLLWPKTAPFGLRPLSQPTAMAKAQTASLPSPVRDLY
jgi:isocitrate/isopropylmalate dehydrogenase